MTVEKNHERDQEASHVATQRKSTPDRSSRHKGQEAGVSVSGAVGPEVEETQKGSGNEVRQV